MPPLFRRVTRNRCHPPLRFEDLVVTLNLDALIGDSDGFRRHLKKALQAAYIKGKKSLPNLLV